MPKVKDDAPERVECRYRLSWTNTEDSYPGGGNVKLALDFLGARDVSVNWVFRGLGYDELAEFVSSAPITKQQVKDVVGSDAFRVFKRVVVLEKKLEERLEKRRWWHWFWTW